MTSHISSSGIQDDGDGYCFVRCGCGFGIGPAPDVETVLDMAMEHAFNEGHHAGQQTVEAAVREHGAEA